jgi:hypothetical protein
VSEWEPREVLADLNKTLDIAARADESGFFVPVEKLTVYRDALADLSRQLLPPDHVAVPVDVAKLAFDALFHRATEVRDPEIRRQYNQAQKNIGELIGVFLSATSPDAAAECPECEKGQICEHVSYGFGGRGHDWCSPCPTCNGTGRRPKSNG